MKALSPISRAVCKEEMAHASLLERIDPKVWHIAWHVPSQANPNGHTAFKSLAPSVVKVALSTRRLVSLQDRTVTCTYRTPGRARPRTTHLDAIACIRRFLQHVLPDGFMTVRHFGFLHTRCAIPTDILRRRILPRHPNAFKTPDVEALAPCVASCPTCGNPLRVIMCRWTANQAFRDTGCEADV